MLARPVTHSCLNTALILGLGERVETDPERVRLREEVAQRLPYMLPAQQDNRERGSCKALLEWRTGRGQCKTLVVTIPPPFLKKMAQVSEAAGQKGASVKTVSFIESVNHSSHQT